MRQWNIYKGLKMLKVFNSAQSIDQIGPIYVSPINTNVSFNDNSTENKLILYSSNIFVIKHHLQRPQIKHFI